MKILQAIRDFEITASGGYAIYVLLCVGYVTIFGAIGLFQGFIKWFK